MYSIQNENLEFVSISEAQRMIADNSQTEKIEKEETPKEIKESKLMGIDRYIRGKIQSASYRDHIILEEFRITVPSVIDIDFRFKNVTYDNRFDEVEDEKWSDKFTEHYIRIEKPVKASRLRRLLQGNEDNLSV